MRATRRNETAEALSKGETSSSSRALVVIAEPTEWSRPGPRHPPPDPTFVTQLIANTEQFAQACNHRGENAADASSAYGAQQPRLSGSGRLTRQLI